MGSEMCIRDSYRTDRPSQHLETAHDHVIQVFVVDARINDTRHDIGQLKLGNNLQEGEKDRSYNKPTKRLQVFLEQLEQRISP